MHRPSKSRYCLNNILHRHTASLFLFAIIMDTAWQGRMNGKSPVIKALIDDITAIRESKFNMNAWTDVFRQGSLSGTDVSLSVKVTWTKEHWLLSCPWFKHYKETVWISELVATPKHSSDRLLTVRLDGVRVLTYRWSLIKEILSAHVVKVISLTAMTVPDRQRIFLRDSAVVVKGFAQE